MKLVDDPRLKPYSIGDSGFTALVTGVTGSGKTLALRKLIEMLGPENVVVVATDPRLAPLDGLGVKVLEAWIDPKDDPVFQKKSAEEAWNRIQEFHKDLAAAANNPDIEIPKVIVHDNISNTGDIMALKVAAPGAAPSGYSQWGEVGRSILRMATFYRGLQVRGLVRIMNCTSSYETDDLGRKVPVLQIGTGGQLAPKNISRYIDYQFHVSTRYDPTNKDAGPDGMVRLFQTCEMDGVVAKGSPKLPTPFMKACWWEVYKLTFGIEEGAMA